MFASSQIVELVRRRPFVPIRIVTSSDETFDVTHPDLIMVGQRDVIIGRASANDPRTYDLASHVAIMHVTAVHDLPSPAPITNNGG